MSDLCLNEGTLQSYYDGELAPEMLRQVRAHLSVCSLCTEAVRQAEGEMELATRAFSAEMELSVPSEHLRRRIDDAIAELERPTPLVSNRDTSGVPGWFGSISSALGLSPQSAFGFASVVIFFVLAAVVTAVYFRQAGSQTGFEVLAGNQREVQELRFDGRVNEDIQVNNAVADNRRSLRQVSMRSKRRLDSGSKNNDVMELAHRPLPGERNYLQAISLLTEAIDANGETSLKPTLLADYKRNLEVVNVAVKATQRTARTNRTSPEAAEMLFAVYQSKLDLLSAVAEQSKPMIAQR